MLHKLNSYFQFGFVVFLFLVVETLKVEAQDQKNIIVSLNEEAIGNLKTAIKSDNDGLRKSGIYLAGKHSVSEVSETLVEQLDVETDPSLRILIIRVLYIIDNDRYIDEIYNLAINDENFRVRQMASAIYTVMEVDNSINLVEQTSYGGK